MLQTFRIYYLDFTIVKEMRIYGNGVSINPFATNAINITGIPVPTKIPVKTKLSRLSIS